MQKLYLTLIRRIIAIINYRGGSRVRPLMRMIKSHSLFLRQKTQAKRVFQMNLEVLSNNIFPSDSMIDTSQF